MSRATIRLRRRSKGSAYLEFEPEQRCKCGGLLMVQDHCNEGFERKTGKEFRYECFCDKCKTCDPNGWRSCRQVIDNSPQFFKA